MIRKIGPCQFHADAHTNKETIRRAGWIDMRAENRAGGGTYIDTLVGEAGRHGRGFFFGFTEEDGELLYRGHGDIPAIVTGQKGLVEVLAPYPTGIDQQLQKL